VTKITITKDYGALIPFFIENGLEFEEGEEYGDDEIVKCWRADDESGLAGGCILATREGEYICDGIAVRDDLRAGGLGREMLDLLIAEAKSRGADKLFLVARAPGFFAKSGFIAIERAEAPEFFECFNCPQYQKTCHPKVMRKDI
jgi:N-acetylglutamate synthase-like GNAT family acetyltransferase